MLFSNLDFWVFFAVLYLVAIFFSFFKATRSKVKSLVLVGSLSFYALGDAANFWVLIWIKFLCFFAGKWIDESPGIKTRRQKSLLWTTVVLAIGTLIFFKYAVGNQASTYTMPLGISFFTFQALSYVIDVYRGRTKKADSLHDFMVYVTFFPQLIAGPIERFGQLYPQINNIRVCSLAEMKIPFLLISMAFFKKLFVADSIGPTVQLIFNSDDSRALEFVLGGWAMAMQVYFDFSAYSDFAVGLGLLFGVKLTQNFRPIWFALNPLEFWERWNVTTGRWFRDYLLIPIGGNGSTRWQSARNMIIMFLAIGLWHGATWNWILWGLFQGLIVAAYRDIRKHTNWAEFTPGFVGFLFLQLFMLPISGILHITSSKPILERIEHATFSGAYSLFDISGIKTLGPHLLFYIVPAILLDLLYESLQLEKLQWRHVAALAAICLGFAAFLQKGFKQASFIYFAF